MDKETLIEVDNYRREHSLQDFDIWLLRNIPHAQEECKTAEGEILDSDTQYKLRKYMKLKNMGLTLQEINYLTEEMSI